MTVIAVKNRLVVADRLVTYKDERRNYDENKLKSYKGLILAHVGFAPSAERIEEWFIAGAIPDEFPKDDIDRGSLIVIHKNIGVLEYHSPDAVFFGMETCAFGSGGELALGAMMHGATAEEAVRIAIECNKYCGMGINKRKF